MSLYLKEAPVAVCDRCKVKVYYSTLRADGNSPGLRVCTDCYDVRDPWRLPRPVEKPINLRMPRPDLALGQPDWSLLNEDYSYLDLQDD